MKIIKGCYDPIPDCYSRDLSEIIDNCLQKNCKDRPSIQEILENERLIEWATELGHLVPTEEEVNDLINGQRTDFMTTFMKKKGSNGDSGKGSGQVGLMSRDKLKNKHYTPGIKNNPVSKPGSKLSNEKSNKKTSQSVIVDINEISNDAIDAVDRLSAENSGSKKKAPVPKYGIYQKPVSARGVGRKLSPNLANKDKAPAVSKKSVSSSDTKATSSDNQNKRGYSKPWIRPKTAGVRTEEVKKNKKDELTDKQKESTRKKASDIMDSRRKQIRPIFNNPTDPKNEEVKEEKRGQNDNKAQNEKEVKRPTHNPIRKTKSDEKPSLRKSMKGHQTDEISIELLENDVEEEMPKNQPKPYIQNAGNHAVPKKAGGMRKMRSAQVDSQLSIPLNQLEDDFEKRNTKEGGENPLLVKKVSKNAETDIPKKRGSNASKMIGDIKKRMKNKGGKSMDANQPGFVDANTEITFSNGTDDVLTTGHVDEVENVKRSYVTNDEEEKLEKYNLSNKSKGSSSVNEANTIEDGEGEGEFEFFDYNDKNFFEDSDLSKTPFGDFGLDAIDENEELDDEEEEGSSAAVKRRIKELTHQKDEKWKELKAGPEYEKSKK